jgi:hypothetical protein
MESELRLDLKSVNVTDFTINGKPVTQHKRKVEHIYLDETAESGNDCSTIFLCVPPLSGFGKFFYMGRVDWISSKVSQVQRIYPDNPITKEKGGQSTLLGFTSSPFGNFIITKSFDIYQVRTLPAEAPTTDDEKTGAPPPQVLYDYLYTCPEPIVRLETIKDALVVLTRYKFIVITRDETTGAFVIAIERELSIEEAGVDGFFVGFNFQRDYSCKTDLPLFVFYQTLKLTLNTTVPVYKQYEHEDDRKTCMHFQFLHLLFSSISFIENFHYILICPNL